MERRAMLVADKRGGDGRDDGMPSAEKYERTGGEVDLKLLVAR